MRISVFGDYAKQKSGREFAKETGVNTGKTHGKVFGKVPDELDYERIRQRNENYLPEFSSPERYVRAKLKMLRNEMLIEPTDAEVLHLYELKTETAIDNAVHSIIARHWDEL